MLISFTWDGAGRTLCRCKIVSLEREILWDSLPHFHGVPQWSTRWASGWQLLEQLLRNVGCTNPVCTYVHSLRAGLGRSVRLHSKRRGCHYYWCTWRWANVRFTFLCSSCVGVEEEEAPDIDIYHCPNCEKTHGKSTCKYTMQPVSNMQQGGGV